MKLRRTLLFLVTEDWYFVSHRLPLARAAIAEGYRVIVATRTSRHGDRIRAAGCEVIEIKLRRGSRNPFAEAAALADLVGIYRRVRPDVVHHVALKPVLYGSIAARLTGVPAIINAVAGMGYTFSSKDILARLLRPVMRIVLRTLLGGSNSWVVLQNPDDLQLLTDARAIDKERAILMPGAGVDLNEFRPAHQRDGGAIVLLATRMIWDKGVKEFVGAARQIRETGSTARFVLVGDPDPENPASVPREQLEEWNAEGSVEWWGHQPDMAAVLAQASIFCFPSAYGEGIPKVLLEAAAAGLPIITTDAPGCREVVRDGHNGILVPLRDTGAVARAVARLLADVSERELFGDRSRKIAEERFGVDVVVRATTDLYQRLAPLAPRLLLLVTEDWFVASHWLPLLRGALARGFKVTVATRIQQHGEAIRSLGCEVVPIGLLRSGRSPWGEGIALLEIMRLYRRQRPDVVHHVAMKPVLYGSVAAMITGPSKVVNAMPGLGYAFAGGHIRSRMIRPFILAGLRLALGRRGTIALFENPDDRKLLVDRQVVPADRAVLVPGSGVDLARFVPSEEPPGAPVVILPARLLWDKGVGEFVEAARQLRREGSNARFVLVGGEDPASPAAIPASVLGEWRREGAVELWGHRTDMPVVFASCAIVCLPSYREGLPKALSEGAASGKPVVATDVPGCREVVVDGETGSLVPAHDAPALAVALRRLIADPEIRRRYGRAARARAEAKLGEQGVVDVFLRVYDKLLPDQVVMPPRPANGTPYQETAHDDRLKL